MVPLDFLDGAELALRRALLVPLARGATLHVAHVLAADLPAQQRARAETDARTAIERTVAMALASGHADRALQVTPAVLSGSTHVEIIRHSRRVGAELIVLGRHGRRTVRDKLIGSTATRIVRKGDVPVLVVNLEPAQPYRRPMVAAALEDADGRTIEVALRVLGREVRAIDVVHAVHVPFEGLVSPMPAAREQGGYRSELERKAEEGVAALIEAHARAGIRWNATVRVGDPSEVILTEALVRGTDLIALGTHGRTGIAHVLIGSVAESILTAAPCDLLVSRPIRFSFEQP